MTSALLIDIGNSRIKWRRDDLDRAIGDEPARGEAVDVRDAESLATSESLGDAPVDVAWISNVASPAVGDVVVRALRTRWPDVRIALAEAGAAEGDLVNGYADPARLGVDRWLAAIAAHALLPARSILVCSFGTATTIDLLGFEPPRTRFIGGLILPGPATMHDALLTGTARLPAGDGRPIDFADNTLDAIASGIIAAQVGAVSRTLAAARRRTSSADRMTLLLTGGAAATVAPQCADLDVPSRVVPDLVLHGLAIRARAAHVSYDATTSRSRTPSSHD